MFACVFVKREVQQKRLILFMYSSNVIIKRPSTVVPKQNDANL